jgi:hypothetical protein
MMGTATGRRIDVGRRKYVVQLFRHDSAASAPGAMTPETEPVTLTAAGRNDTARQVGLDFALDRLPEGDDWEILVWEPAMVGHEVAARISPMDAERTDIPAKSSARASRKRKFPRTRGPVAAVVNKVLPSEKLLGATILVSSDSANGVGSADSGWRAASAPGPDVIATRVRGYSVNPVNGQVALVTAHGTLALPPRVGVIPE